jgi:Glycosyltransferase like family 2
VYSSASRKYRCHHKTFVTNGGILSNSVLITTYRRPEKLSRVLDSDLVRNADNLVISIDGINGDPGDEILRKKVLEVISAAHLKDSVEIIESSNHLGLYSAMHRALDYAFAKFSRVTVLEEDCVPSPQTEFYLQQLQDFRNLKNMHICLSRHVKIRRFSKFGRVTITKYPFVWGWNASREVWERSRGGVVTIDEDQFRHKLRELPSWHPNFEKFWFDMLYSCQDVEKARNSGNLETMDLSIGMRNRVKNSWATPYTINYWLQSGVTGAVRPPINLIANIGFGNQASHTKRKPAHARAIDGKKLGRLGFLDADQQHLNRIEDLKVFGIKI